MGKYKYFAIILLLSSIAHGSSEQEALRKTGEALVRQTNLDGMVNTYVNEQIDKNFSKTFKCVLNVVVNIADIAIKGEGKVTVRWVF